MIRGICFQETIWGNNIGFRTDTKSGQLGESHKNNAFTDELGAFVKSYQESKGDNNKLITS